MGEWTTSVLRKADVRMRAGVQGIYRRGQGCLKRKKSVGRHCAGATHIKGTGIQRRKMLAYSKKALSRQSGVKPGNCYMSLIIVYATLNGWSEQPIESVLWA